MRNELLLVGNAASLLTRHGLGEAIDRFGVVVRFNNFVTAGFEECVGVRTDVWARNETDEVLPRTERFGRILLRLQGEDAETYQRGGEALLPQLKLDHPGAVIEVILRSVFTELIAAHGFKGAPLTGTMAAAHYLRRIPRVHICGFDNLVGTPETLRHYYSDENRIEDWTTYHEPDKEAAYLRGLIRAGRVVVL